MNTIYTKAIIYILVIVAIYTRVVGLNWGLPYPFHPDERNIADGIMRLECTFSESTLAENLETCMNPGFYAYGQPTIYIGYLGVQTWHMFADKFGEPVNFSEAVMSLRLQSAMYSLLLLVVLWKIIERIMQNLDMKKSLLQPSQILVLSLAVFIFQPYAIQFAHFGTTETLLMLLYGLVLLQSMYLYEKITLKRLLLVGVILGVSIGVKLSSLAFAGVPFIIIGHSLLREKKLSLLKRIRNCARSLSVVALIAFIFACLASPHFLINFDDFMFSMDYEIAVGSGLPVFYTRQFMHTIPLLFQFVKVFPFSHGYVQTLLFIIGFILLPWKNPYINIMRLGFLIYFIPSGVVYTKWARFMAPIMPVMTILAFTYAMFAVHRRAFRTIRIGSLYVAIIILVINGYAYLSIYQSEDVRFQASQWMTENIERDATVLIETGNVINLPVQIPYRPVAFNRMNVIPFNFYDLDEEETLQQDFINVLDRSDYIIIASRRVFANQTCQWPDQSPTEYLSQQLNPFVSGKYPIWCDDVYETYPLVNEFFMRLFNGDTYELVKTYSVLPHISFAGRTLLTFPDEHAEEAWTVFDHPVIRIYRRV